MTAQSPRLAIPKEFSIYLDLLRFSAALFVMLFHIRKLQVGPASILQYVPDHGHDAVILFFVLSGYVIAAATDRKHAKGPREYILDRMARVYSVAIPTLLFSAILVIFFHQFLDVDGKYSLRQLFVDSAANFFFIAQSWSWKIWVYFNQPYWSLCYEVMYYIGFGIFTFAKGWKRWFGLSLVALIAGPKVLLLFPCWALGVFAYTHRDQWTLRPATALLIGFALPLIALIVLHYIGFGPLVRSFGENVLGTQKEYLEFSNDFLIDYVTAALVAINLYAVRYITFNLPKLLQSLFVEGAAMSFTLYLMHLPIIFIIVNVSGAWRNSLVMLLVATVGVPLLCYLISLFTEHQRPKLRLWLAKILP